MRLKVPKTLSYAAARLVPSNSWKLGFNETNDAISPCIIPQPPVSVTWPRSRVIKVNPLEPGNKQSTAGGCIALASIRGVIR